jgi:Ran-binding protein 9/10
MVFANPYSLEIRAAILEGDIDKALKHTNAYYPSVLRENENIYFKLRCRKFIEMIRATQDLSAQLHLQTVPTPVSKRSVASNGHTDDYDFEMELDEQLNGPKIHPQANSAWRDGQAVEDEGVMEDEELDTEEAQARYQKLTEEMLEYGMVLKQEFAADQRREIKRALGDTFALIAYENVGESPMAQLLEPAGRVPVAEELNSAILGM